RHADCGHDRRWVLRRAREGLNWESGISDAGGAELTGNAVGSVTRLLAALLMLQAGTGFVFAQGFQAAAFQTPAISVVRVEWRAVLDQMRSEIGAVPSVAADFSFALQRRVPASDPRSMPGLVQLNAATSPIFAGIARSPVPVLLPFD